MSSAAHRTCFRRTRSAAVTTLEHAVGDYEDDFKHTPVADGLHGFQQNLSAAEDEIVGRNRRRLRSYDYLRPSLVPNSTNI
jgi:arachidonate 15-lipoxygenase